MWQRLSLDDRWWRWGGLGLGLGDEKRAGWVRLIGDGLEKQLRRKELISSGDRKDVKQIITLRKGAWARVADRLRDRERAHRYGFVTGNVIPFNHPRLGDSEWEEEDTQAHTLEADFWLVTPLSWLTACLYDSLTWPVFVSHTVPSAEALKRSFWTTKNIAKPWSRLAAPRSRPAKSDSAHTPTLHPFCLPPVANLGAVGQ